ncbi:MAG: hypothetical protein H6662_04130 [Ardenticatenaceae bacterium]|nr:hypothetical protein [Anaerolineales bacterium]MCB8920752.1 hypothetical protein [Ardenticatenaceae bacterium]MCB8989711.1 hypothetical protein [Ardenticatenaceae bacterium]MCB9002830.1 hypothetical protein [Ardenticatenaceae bacterium]
MQSYDTEQDWFLTKAQVEERPFTSHTPLLGPLIAWFRTQWNNISAKWYVRPILAQQNTYNRLVAERLSDIDNRLITLDHEHTQLIHDIAELNIHFAQTNQLLQSIDTRLANIEKQEQTSA